MRTNISFVGSLGIGVCFMLLVFGTVYTSAHAALSRSDPAPDAILDQPPPEVLAWFSQALTSDSHLTVFDSQFRTVNAAESSVDPGDGTLMRVKVPQLEPGRYTVNWKANSIDGHQSSGSYDFFVRESPSAMSIIVIGAGAVVALITVI